MGNMDGGRDAYETSLEPVRAGLEVETKPSSWVLPLVFASGPGANARHSIGTTVLGGMVASTVLSLLIVPVIYIVVEYLRSKVGVSRPQGDEPTPSDAPAA